MFIGTYNESEILTGPEKVAKRIFNEYALTQPAVFLEYFQDGKKYGLFKKIFGKEIVRESNDSQIIRTGIVYFVFYLFYFRPDIIHIITFERFSQIAFYFKRLLNYKIIFNLHGIVYYENTELNITDKKLIRKNHNAERKFISQSDILLYLSEFYIDIGYRFYNIDKKKLVKIKNGVDDIFFGGTDNEKKLKENETLSIVFSGDIERKDKGFEFLADTLDRSDIKMKLYIVGSNTYKREFKSNIEVTFSGFLDPSELKKLYSDKEIFISASYYDTFSIASAEAMSAGLTGVLTNSTGFSEYINDGVTGYKVDYGDTKCLSEILKKLNSDRKLLREISKQGQLICNDLKWNEVLVDYKKVYNNLIN